MKKILIAIIICTATVAANAMPFTIKGNIKGIMPSDTLSFEKIILPDYTAEAGFDVIVEKKNEFIYQGNHEHINYYSVTYKPRVGEVADAKKTGFSFLAKDGTTHLKGTISDIYSLNIQSKIYDNILLQKYINLDNSLDKEQSYYLREGKKAIKAGKKVEGDKLIAKYNDFYSLREKEIDKLIKMEEKIYNDFPSLEYTVLQTLLGVKSNPFEETQEKYAKMNEQAKSEYLGTLLKQAIDKLALLQPGQAAPDFHLTSLSGREISLADLKGKYILIYHWGMCPGSLKIDNEVIELYEKYKEHLEIIGATASIENIKNIYNDTNEEYEIMGIKLKSVLKNMLAHPWIDIDLVANNYTLHKDYGFAGLPYFVIISPDGKIIDRAFQKAFYTAKKELQEKFGE